MAEVLICPKGSLDKRSVNDLRKAGVIVVQADDPTRVQFVRSGEVVSSNDMLWAALDVLWRHGGSTQRERFTALLFEIADAKRSESATPPAAVDPSAQHREG